MVIFVYQYMNLGSNISPTECDVNKHIDEVLIAVDRLTSLWKSDLSDKLKWEVFQAVVTAVLLYSCSLTKRLKKKLDWNYKRMPLLFQTNPESSNL